jgi:Bacterial Ig-like domain (group 2)
VPVPSCTPRFPRTVGSPPRSLKAPSTILRVRRRPRTGIDRRRRQGAGRENSRGSERNVRPRRPQWLTAPSPPIAEDLPVVAVFVAGIPFRSFVGEETQLTATVKFSNHNLKSGATTQVTWASSNPAVLTVSVGGVMHVVSLGEGDITATFKGGSGPRSCHRVACWSSGVKWRGAFDHWCACPRRASADRRV